MATSVVPVYSYVRDDENRPLITICDLYADPRKDFLPISRGMAFCSETDNPNKEFGRTLARQRAEHSRTWKLHAYPINDLGLYLSDRLGDFVSLFRYKGIYFSSPESFSKHLVIGLAGEKGSGKTTTANALCANEGIRLSFADRLKDLCMTYFDMSYDQCYGEDHYKNTKTRLRWERFPIPDERKKKVRGFMTAREVLQYFGTEIIRQINKTIWINMVVKRIGELGSPHLIVIDDVRYSNEITALQKIGGKIIRLTRSVATDGHSSENGLQEYEERGGKFDLIVDNQNLSFEETVETISTYISERANTMNNDVVFTKRES